MAFGKWANSEEFNAKVKEIVQNGELVRLARQLAQTTHDRIIAVEKKKPGAKLLTAREKELTAKLTAIDPTETWRAFVQKFLKDLGRG